MLQVQLGWICGRAENAPNRGYIFPNVVFWERAEQCRSPVGDIELINVDVHGSAAATRARESETQRQLESLEIEAEAAPHHLEDWYKHRSEQLTTAC